MKRALPITILLTLLLFLQKITNQHKKNENNFKEGRFLSDDHYKLYATFVILN